MIYIIIAGIAAGMVAYCLRWKRGRKARPNPLTPVNRPSRKPVGPVETARRARRQAISALQAINQPEYSPAQRLSYLRNISPYAFEDCLILGFRKSGLRAFKTLGYTRDGGIDGEVRIQGKPVVIQAKRYRGHVPKSVIWDLKSVIDRHRYHGGLLIHTGKVSRENYALAARLGIEIVGGSRLLQLLAGQFESQRLNPGA